MLGIDQCNHRIEHRFAADVVIHEESLGNRHGIGKPCRLDDNGIEPPGTAHQALHHADQVAAYGAAYAAIVHFINFFVQFDDQIVVDTDLAKFVDDDSIPLAVIFTQDAVEKCCFS